MENTTESRETARHQILLPKGRTGHLLTPHLTWTRSSTHPVTGSGNTAPLRSDTGAIDMDAISQVAHVTQGAGKLTRKEKKRAKREMKRRKKEAKKAEKSEKDLQLHQVPVKGQGQGAVR